jgi:hypothetical protein
MIARGLGVDTVDADRRGLYSLVQSGSFVPALPYDLTFPEVFYPTGVPHGRRGFHAVLGNPPWDSVRPLVKEFLSGFDLSILDAPTKRERAELEERLLTNATIRLLHERYLRDVEEQIGAFRNEYQNQQAVVDGRTVGGDFDLARLFSERIFRLTRSHGI